MQERFVEFLREEAFDDKEIALILYLVDEELGGIEDAVEQFADGTEEYDENAAFRTIVEDDIRFKAARWDDKYFETTYGDFVVYDDEDEAEQDALENVQQTVEDCGFTCVNGWEDFVTEDWFEDAMRESGDFYADDIASESSDDVRGFESRLIEECFDADLIDDDDFEVDEDGEPDYSRCKLEESELIELLSEHMYDSNMDSYGSASEWYKSEFGRKDFEDIAVENGLIDMDALARYVIKYDGVAMQLARYDFEEREYEFEGTTYYIYRDN